MFELDPAFAATSDLVGDLPLCQVRVQRDARYPWLVLIPRVAGAREIEDLDPAQRHMLTTEIVQAGAAVRAIAEALGLAVTKLNVGLLGNITPQLHAHVIGRHPDDPAWPDPVWGHSAAAGYLDVDLETAIAAARRSLVLDAG